MDIQAGLKDPNTWLKYASDKLDHARQLFTLSLYDDAISRSYFAMLYAAKAALLSEGYEADNHSGIFLGFRDLFVTSGRVQKNYLRYLAQVREARKSSDYAPYIPVLQQDAQAALARAQAFIVGVNAMIKKPDAS